MKGCKFDSSHELADLGQNLCDWLMSLAVIVPNYLQATKPIADYTRFLSALSNNYDGAAINRGDQWVEQLQRLQLAPVRRTINRSKPVF